MNERSASKVGTNQFSRRKKPHDKSEPMMLERSSGFHVSDKSEQMGDALEGLVEIAYFVTVQGLREICKGLTNGERRLLISLAETKKSIALRGA